MIVIVFAKCFQRLKEISPMKTREPSDLIVEVFAVAVSDLVALGLSREEAVLGLLSQAAVQANPGAMVHAAVLHQKFHSDFVES